MDSILDVEMKTPIFKYSGVLKDEEIIFLFVDKKELKHLSRRIAYWEQS